MRKTVLFGKNLQLFYYLCSQFSRFLRNYSIMRVFWTITSLYFKKIFFLTLLQEIPNFKIRIFEKYKSQKKKQLWNPLATHIKCPPNKIFKKKSAAPYWASFQRLCCLGYGWQLGEVVEYHGSNHQPNKRWRINQRNYSESRLWSK